MCGYGTLQAPEFDEGERIADSPVEEVKGKKQALQVVFWFLLQGHNGRLNKWETRRNFRPQSIGSLPGTPAGQG